MSASLKEKIPSPETSLPKTETKKEKRLTLVDPTATPYFVSQFERNPRGWIWDLVLGLYILAVIGFVILIEFKS